MEKTFYCANEAGTNFDINEWNRKFSLANQMGLSGVERERFLGECRCETQCIECACIVGERRLKTQRLINEK